jgi:hypothetical protein
MLQSTDNMLPATKRQQTLNHVDLRKWSESINIKLTSVIKEYSYSCSGLIAGDIIDISMLTASHY